MGSFKGFPESTKNINQCKHDIWGHVRIDFSYPFFSIYYYFQKKKKSTAWRETASNIILVD